MALWFVLAILSAIVYGAAYPILHYLKDINVCLIQSTYGLTTLAVGCFSIAVSGSITQDSLDAWTSGTSIGLLLAYCACLIAGNYLYLAAVQSPGAQVSVVTAMSSAYVVITLLLAFAIYQEYKNLNLYIAIPCILAITGGAVGLAFSGN